MTSTTTTIPSAWCGQSALRSLPTILDTTTTPPPQQQEQPTTQSSSKRQQQQQRNSVVLDSFLINHNKNNNNHNIPSKLLVTDRKSFGNATTTTTTSAGNVLGGGGGLDVVKVTKSGKLQPRRIAISISSPTASSSTTTTNSSSSRSSRCCILVTSNRIRSFKGFWKSLVVKTSPAATAASRGGAATAASGSGSASSSSSVVPMMKAIDIASIDRIQRGAFTKRFLQQQRSSSSSSSIKATSSSASTTTMADPTSNCCLSIIYRVSTDASSSSLLETMGSSSAVAAAVLSSPTKSFTSSGPAAATSSTSLTATTRLAYRLESLDLIINNPKDFDLLATTLEQLVEHYHRQERNVLDRDVLLLEHVWMIELEKKTLHSSFLSASEWIVLCDKLNVPLKKQFLLVMFKTALAAAAMDNYHNQQQLQQQFLDDTATITTTTTTTTTSPPDGLSLKDVANLLPKLRKASLEAIGITDVDLEDYATRLWNDMVATDPVPLTKEQYHHHRNYNNNNNNNSDADSYIELAVEDSDDDDGHVFEESISTVALLSFIRSQQKEYRTALEDATRLCHALHQLVTTADYKHQQQYQQSAAADHSSGTALSETTTTIVATSKTGKSSSTTTPATSASPTARLSKSKFLSYLMSDANDLMDPTKGTTGSMDMSMPLSHYWIHTAHDTYLARLPNALVNNNMVGSGSGGRNNAKDTTSDHHYSYHRMYHDMVDEQMYWAALYRGVRCLELDVWDGNTITSNSSSSSNSGNLSSYEPIVARKPPTATSSNKASLSLSSFLMFADVLRIVRAFLLQHPHSFPILLKLENHCSLPFQKKMAQQLQQILGNLLYMPQPTTQEQQQQQRNGQATKSPLNTSAALPSPAALRGLVVLIGKRPKKIRPGATVINDDFDEDNGVAVDDDEMVLNELLEDDEDEDDDDDDENEAVVIGFNERGPIKKPLSTPGAIKRSPALLLEIATKECHDAQRDAKLAERRLAECKTDATSAEMLAAQITEEAGFTPSQVRAIAAAEATRDEVAPGGFEVEIDAHNRNHVNVRGLDYNNNSTDHYNEGLEVQDFFGDAVEGAKTQYTAADAKALEATQHAARALAKYTESKLALQHAERDLESSYQREKDLARDATRAAAEARTNREHADTARRRVETVRELLKNCADNATSAETVVVTAYTEAKISEQRASEAEARASRAMATADKDRAVADDESRKEEVLEQEVERLHANYVETTKTARAVRERLDKATAMLDRVNEQIKLIEQSSQFQKEIRDQKRQCLNNNTSSFSEDDADSSQNSASKPRHGGKFLDKHAAKIDERKMCQELIKEASNECAAADQQRRQAHSVLEDRMAAWKMQAERAAALRKQAERSSHIAEELAEHAEEEREAASLRHIAREKAQANVQQSDSYRSSVESQLAEAERAASEAASLAVESRNRAEQLAREAEKAKNHTEAILLVEHKKRDLELATREYDVSSERKIQADQEAATAKRLLETSAEVYTSAQRDAAAEIHRANQDRAVKRRAVDAYNKALQSRKALDRAKEQFKGAKAMLLQKNVALKQAQIYKQRADKITNVHVQLASSTLLHTCKHKHWTKSLSLPSAYMHSLAQGVVQQMVDKDAAKQREYFCAFTSNHLLRTFPAWNVIQHTPHANYDPVFQWSLGCQLVAMNMSCVDERVLVADGRFRANGSSGYVLKPEFLLDDTQPRDRPERWKFSILSASCLPKPESHSGRKGGSLVTGPSMHYVNPYVKISIYDETTTSSPSGKVIHTTRPVPRNGFNPIWKEKNEVEVAIPTPSLAILLLSVWDSRSDHQPGSSGASSSSDDFIAAAAMPISCIREGYRSVPLFDSMHTRCGPYAFASLLVKAQKLAM